MSRSLRTRFLFILSCLLLAALLPACAQASLAQPAVGPAAMTAPTGAVPVDLVIPTSTSPMPMPAPTTTTAAASISGEGITLAADPALASGGTVEIIPAVAGTAESPYWEAAPEYRLVTLSGYPVVNNDVKPQIFVYPVDAYKSANPAAAKRIDEMKAQLETPMTAEELPFLPLINARQMLHAHLHNLDFQNGRGYCYLTQLAQGIVQVNNHEMFYTCQTLTDDGKYYVAAILPVSHPSLNAADEPLTEKQLEELAIGFQKYLSDQASALDAQPAGSFTPDLAKLDAMMSSLEVQ